ncbi:pyridoxal phosphate-dependent aminotransferase [Paenibacillus sp. FSL H3-0333]|uniref:pyridoxal phosphate-dependent aminotransferase n=1 Tax=Paenibacillus sp. FSL H3-0333 TaxID=2921373 RepID=UPI0030F863C7
MNNILDQVRRKRDRKANVNQSIGGLLSANSLQMNLSAGINQFPPPELYREYLLKDSLSGDFVKKYSEIEGNADIREAILFYERYLTSGDVERQPEFPQHVCITVGATQAIALFMEYYSCQHPGSTVMLLGLSYYLFYECCERQQLQAVTIMSQEAGRIAPVLAEIEAALDTYNPELLILTLPFNPSGEIYSETELEEIIGLLQRKGITLLIDKCQLNELADQFEFININRVIERTNYSEHTYVINSLSKTRSIPGARIGYILCNEEFRECVSYWNELFLFSPPTFYVTPFIIDMVYRVLFLHWKKTGCENEIQQILRKFREQLLYCGGREMYIRHLKPILKNRDVIQDVMRFAQEIRENHDQVQLNSIYFSEAMGVRLESRTELGGGFNFCVRIRGWAAKDQLDICHDLLHKTRIILMPESCFNNNIVSDLEHPFWFRISAALPSAHFAQLTDSLIAYIDERMPDGSVAETDSNGEPLNLKR